MAGAQPQGRPQGQPLGQPLGRLVDSLGVEHRPEEGELVLGAVVLLKVMGADGEVAMRASWSPGLTWMERVGMHHAAARTDLPDHGPPARAPRRDEQSWDERDGD